MTSRALAVVGMGCRFPGAPTVPAFWDLVLRAEPQFTDVPADRWEHAPYVRPGRPELGYSYTDQVAFVDEVDQFAAQHFRVSARRARAMDPQQRLLLEVTREALQDAGWEHQIPRADRAGVFFALSNSEYAELAPDVDQVEAYSVPGNLLNMAATTVSQFYDLGGPSFALDAACSAGLVALEQAALHLRNGDCEVALVGGAYLNLVPHSLVGFSQVGALSKAGVCRPFDERADGFVLGEGVGVMALRPLEDALAEGDRVYAVVHGIGSANDGRTDGPMTPRMEGQLRAMERAYADAGIDPGEVGFLEAHGTATTVGDAVEAASIRALRSDSAAGGQCYLGAVKALVGHGLTMSGLAGVMKAVLAVHHGVVPPQPDTHVGPQVQEHLTSADVAIAGHPERWESQDRPRIAAVNSFGFGGTNVHAIVGQAPDPQASGEQPATDEEQARLFAFSAGSPELLADYVEAVADELTDDAISLQDLAWTLAHRRPLPARAAVVAQSRSELEGSLRAVADHLRTGGRAPRGATVVHKAAAAPRVTFVFPGQGAQKVGMLSGLYERFETYRNAVRELSATATAAGGPDVAQLLYGDSSAAADGLSRTDQCQPVLGVTGAALTRQLADLGVTPSLALGHSVGEFVAAAAAGSLTPEDLVRMLAARGRCIADRIPAGQGAMMLVQADPAQVAELIEGEAAWPACLNHPSQVTISGDATTIDALVARAKARRLPATRLAVSHAFHSPLLEPVEESVRSVVGHLPVQPPEHTFVSTVSGRECSDPDQLRSLWDTHASVPVQFEEAARSAYEIGSRVFLQVAGGGALLKAVRASVADDDCAYVALSGDGADDVRTFLAGLGALYAHGVPADLVSIAGSGRIVSLPSSPLLRRRYWTAMDRRNRDEESAAPTADRTTRHATPHQGREPVPTTPRTAEPPSAAGGFPKESAMNDVVALMREQLAVLSSWTGQESPAAGPDQSPAAASPAPAAPEPAAGPADAARAAVLAELSSISGVEACDITDDQSVIEDLGFDSLLFAELMTRLRRSVAQFEGWPPEAPRRPTVGDVVTAVGGQPVETASAPVVAGPAPVRVVTPPVQAENGLAQWSDLAEHEAELATLDPNPFFLEHEGRAAATTTIDGRDVVCFSSYNYLGLSGAEQVVEAVTDAVRTYGSSVSASRFLSGERTIHRELETELAGLLGTEDAIVLVSGHATNASVIGHIVGPEDLIVHDELAHDSILQGCHASGATRRPFAHNDPQSLDAVLTRLRPKHRRALVIVEGVYSMDGDLAALPELIEVKERHGAVLMVDEAHSIGTVGAHGGGVGEHFDVDRASVDLWAGTMSKSLSSCGGYVAGSRRLVEYLKYTVPGFVYSVGITPANAAAALTSLRMMRAEPERLQRLRDNSRLFAQRAREAGLDIGPADGFAPVVPCIVGDSAIALGLADALLRDGVSVNPIMYPAVPEEHSRLRFFVTADHSVEQIESTVRLTADLLAELRHRAATATETDPLQDRLARVPA